MPNMPDSSGNALHGKDYHFGRLVPFVQIDEYYEEPRKKRRREKLEYWLPPYSRQSLYRFTKEGLLLSCHTQAQNARQSWQEELSCRYENSLLKGRTFTAKGRDDEQHLEEKRSYNEHNLLIEKCIWQGDRLQQRSCYRYDENFRLVCEENGEKNGNYTRSYLYNSKGFCEEERIYCNGEHKKSFLYACDERGRMIESWEESPKGQTCRVHKYQYNQQQLLSRYQLINQDGLLLQNLEYQYGNFVEKDWLERYVWRLGGRAGRLSAQLAHSCLRSPCMAQRPKDELEQRFSVSRKSLKLPEGNYQGQTRVGLMHGYGRLNFFDGSYYIGHFEAGRMDGYGSFYWPDGRSYRGYFANNRMQGRGNYYQADGSLYCGIFEEGKLLSSRPHYYLSGDSPLSRANRKAENMRPTRAEPHAGKSTEAPEAPKDQKESTHQPQPQSHAAQTNAGANGNETHGAPMPSAALYAQPQREHEELDNLNRNANLNLDLAANPATNLPAGGCTDGNADGSENVADNASVSGPSGSRALALPSGREFVQNAKRAVRRQAEQEREQAQQQAQTDEGREAPGPDEEREAPGDWRALYSEANLAMHYLGQDAEEAEAEGEESEDNLFVEPVYDFWQESLDGSLLHSVENGLQQNEAAHESGKIIKALLEPVNLEPVNLEPVNQEPVNLEALHPNNSINHNGSFEIVEFSESSEYGEHLETEEYREFSVQAVAFNPGLEPNWEPDLEPDAAKVHQLLNNEEREEDSSENWAENWEIVAEAAPLPPEEPGAIKERERKREFSLYLQQQEGFAQEHMPEPREPARLWSAPPPGSKELPEKPVRKKDTKWP